MCKDDILMTTNLPCIYNILDAYNDDLSLVKAAGWPSLSEVEEKELSK
jgi:hypothetical protein